MLNDLRMTMICGVEHGDARTNELERVSECYAKSTYKKAFEFCSKATVAGLFNCTNKNKREVLTSTKFVSGESQGLVLSSRSLIKTLEFINHFGNYFCKSGTTV